MARAIKNLLLDEIVALLLAGTYPDALRMCKRGNPNEVTRVTEQPAIFVYAANETKDVVASPLQFNELEVVVVYFANATEATQEDVGIEYAASIEEKLAIENALVLDLGGGIKIGVDLKALGSRVVAGGPKPSQAAGMLMYKAAYSTGLGTPRGIR